MSANFRQWRVGVAGSRLADLLETQAAAEGSALSSRLWGANQASTYLDSLLSAVKLFGVNHGKFFSTTQRQAESAALLPFYLGTRLGKILRFGGDRGLF